MGAGSSWRSRCPTTRLCGHRLVCEWQRDGSEYQRQHAGFATGTGPLAFGDSIIVDRTPVVTIDDRTPNGYLDDFQLYDEVLTSEQITFLFNNPAGAILEPSTALLEGWEFALLYCRRR